MVTDSTITIREIQSGSRRGEYVWVLENNKLIPVRELGKIKRKEGTSRRKEIEIEVPLEKLIGRTIYIFGFSGRGYLYISKKAIKTKKDIEDLHKNTEKVEHKEVIQLLLNYYDRKLAYLNEIREYSGKVRKLMEELGYKSIMLERGRRTEEAIMDFEKFVCSELSNPSIQGVAAALKNIFRTIHELLIFLSIVKLLKEKRELLYQSSLSETLMVHTTEGEPYFIFENKDSYLLVTYQFQPVPQEKVSGSGAVKMLFENREIQKIPDAWKKISEILEKLKGHIRPDILIFEVKKNNIKPEVIYSTLRDLLYRILLADNEEEKRKALAYLNSIVNKVILIDCKIDFGVKDIEQLEYYKKLFNEIFYNKPSKFYIISPYKDYIVNRVPSGWTILKDNEIENIIKDTEE